MAPRTGETGQAGGSRRPGGGPDGPPARTVRLKPAAASGGGMRAVAIPSFRATPELMDRPKPEVGAGEILVHLRAAGVNPMDWKIIDGAFEGRMPHDFPLIP